MYDQRDSRLYIDDKKIFKYFIQIRIQGLLFLEPHRSIGMRLAQFLLAQIAVNVALRGLAIS